MAKSDFLIVYILCCKIVSMFYNVECMVRCEYKEVIFNLKTNIDMSDKIKNTDKGSNDTIHSVMPRFDSPKNWVEDYKHENGNYICKCYKCKEYFYGHKRRPLCKECGS